MKIKKVLGFTLLEMIITVVIIAILAAIALPSYQRYILKSHRVDARNTLQQIAQKLEQNYSAFRTYACQENKSPTECPSDKKINSTWLSNNGFEVSPAGATGSSVRYEIAFDGEPTARSYKLKAEAKNSQRNDICKIFFINQSNIKTANSATSRDSISIDCWDS